MDDTLRQLIRDHYQRTLGQRKFVPGQTVIPASGKLIDDRDMAAMVEAVLEGWWTEGRHAAEFERRLAALAAAPGCVTTCSGSSANLLAFGALTSAQLGERRLQPGDEVITIAAGFPTTINPIILYGCRPVFVDVEIATMNTTVRHLAAALSEKSRAVFMPHNLGVPFDLDGVVRFCREHNLWLIEDCCDALGSTYRGQSVGSFGDLATFSFYAGHQITMGEGGAVVCRTPKLGQIVRSLRDWGRDCWCKTGEDNACRQRFSLQFGTLPAGYDHKYVFTELGYNLRLTDIQAAAGLVQLEKLPAFTARRQENFARLRDGLAAFEQWLILPEAPVHTQPSWFGFYLTQRRVAPFQRAELINFLESRKITTRQILAGNLTRQPYLQTYHVPYRQVGELPNTDSIMAQSFWVGCYQALGAAEMDYIVKTFHEYLSRYQ